MFISGFGFSDKFNFIVAFILTTIIAIILYKIIL